MADNPMEMLGNILSNPDALKTMGKLFEGVVTPASQPEENLDLGTKLPDFSSQSFGEDDNGTRLLYALEPYLSQKRRGNISQIVQAVKIGKMVSAMSKKR